MISRAEQMYRRAFLIGLVYATVPRFRTPWPPLHAVGPRGSSAHTLDFDHLSLCGWLRSVPHKLLLFLSLLFRSGGFLGGFGGFFACNVGVRSACASHADWCLHSDPVLCLIHIVRYDAR